MKRLRHPNIIQFVDVFETSEQLLLVLEYAPGKELFDVILAKNSLPEPYARIIFAQVGKSSNILFSVAFKLSLSVRVPISLCTRSLEQCIIFIA